MTDDRKVGENTPKNKGNAGKGREKGVPNKVTGEIRDMIKTALAEAGGTNYLIAQANENPVAFMGLIGKIIPKEVEAHVTGEIRWPVPKGKLG